MSWWDRLIGRGQLRETVSTLTADLTEVRSTLESVSERLQEVNALAMMYDPDLNLTANQGGSMYMRRLTQSARDFSPIQHTKALKLAFWLYETNPLAKRILSTTAAYLIGDGFHAEADYKEDGMKKDVQEVVDEFWDDHVNQLDLKLPGLALELGMWGELCLTAKPNKVDGLVRIDTVDPENILDVLFDEKGMVSLVLQSKQGNTKKERLKIIRVDEDPGSDSYGLLVGATTDEDGNIIETWQDVDADGKPIGEAQKYLGSAMFYRVNNVSKAKRGRSDLLAVMDWLDAYDQELFNELERSQLLKAFVWSVELKGKDEAWIRNWLKTNGTPKPGAVRGHNEEVKWEAVTPDLKTKDATELSKLILGHISTGTQYPKTWLNVTDDVNKATGQVLDEPTFRWMSARQRYLRFIVVQLLTYQLDQAELAGRLSRGKIKGSIKPEPWQITVNTPELRSRDLKQNGDAFARAVEGLVNAVNEHFIDIDTAQRVAVLLVEEFGIDVDLDEMRVKIDEKIAADEAKMVPTVVPPGTPVQPGQTVPVVPAKPTIVAPPQPRPRAAAVPPIKVPA